MPNCIVKITRTKVEDEVPLIVCSANAPVVEPAKCTYLKKVDPNTVSVHIATIPFGGYVADVVPCKPCHANVVETADRCRICACKN